MDIRMIVFTVFVTEIVRSTYHYFKGRFRRLWVNKGKKRLTALLQKLRLIFFN